MNNKLKKSVALFLLIPFLWGVVIKPANAILPALWAAAVWATTDTLGIALTTSLGLHAAVAAINFSDTSAAPADKDSAPLTVMLNPKAPLPATPAGWTAPVAPSTQPTPPSTATKGTPYYVRAGQPDPVHYPDFETACTAEGASFVSTGYTRFPNGSNCTFFRSSTNTYQNITITQLQGTCPTGYTAGSGSTCNLSTPDDVQKPSDNKTTIQRVGDTFVADPKDITDQVKPGMNVVASPKSIHVDDGNGNEHTLLINDDSTSTLTSTSIDNGAATTSVATTNFSAPNSSTGTVTVTGKSTKLIQGIGTGVTPSGSDGIDTSNLNKEVTQGQIKAGIDTLHTDLSTAPEGVDMADVKTAQDAAYDAHIAAVTDLATGGLDSHGLSWGFTPAVPSASCSPVNYGVPGHSYTWDICPTVDKVRDIAGYVFYILTAFFLFAILTGRRGD